MHRLGEGGAVEVAGIEEESVGGRELVEGPGGGQCQRRIYRRLRLSRGGAHRWAGWGIAERPRFSEEEAWRRASDSTRFHRLGEWSRRPRTARGHRGRYQCRRSIGAATSQECHCHCCRSKSERTEISSGGLTAEWTPSQIYNSARNRTAYQWEPGGSGGDLSPAWPEQVVDLLKKRLCCFLPAPCGFVACEALWPPLLQVRARPRFAVVQSKIITPVQRNPNWMLTTKT